MQFIGNDYIGDFGYNVFGIFRSDVGNDGTKINNWVNEYTALLSTEIPNAFKNLNSNENRSILCALAHSDDTYNTDGTYTGTYSKFLKDLSVNTMGDYSNGKNYISTATKDMPYFGYIKSFGGDWNHYYVRVLDFLWNCDGTAWPQWEYILNNWSTQSPFGFIANTMPAGWKSLQTIIEQQNYYKYGAKDQNTGAFYQYKYYTQNSNLGTFLYMLIGPQWYNVVPQKVLDYFKVNYKTTIVPILPTS